MALTLEDVRGLSDSLKNFNFDLVIPNVPGGGDGEAFRLHVVTAAIPGLSSEIIERAHHGFTVKEAGRGQFPRVFPCEFYESSDLKIFKALKAWHDLQWDKNTGAQAARTVYTTSIYLKTLGNDRNESASIKMNSCFIEDIADSPVSGDNSETVRVSVTFSYDDWDFD